MLIQDKDYVSMQVKLITYTPDAEKQIIYIARVSNPQNQNNPEYSKLLRYLLRQKHYSPFEHAYFTFEIKTSRVVAQQLIRHRSFIFQEFSQRYSIATEIEPIELRRQADKNRQSSTEVFNPITYDYRPKDGSVGYTLYADDEIAGVMRHAMAVYDRLIKAGVAKESARFVLPLATQTTIYMTGSVRSWIHYLELRTDEHAQKEHRIIATAIKEILKEYLPVTFRALDEIKQEQENNHLLLQLLESRHLTDLDVLQSYLDHPV